MWIRDPFLDVLDRALARADDRHFIFDELRSEVEWRRWERPKRDDAAFYSLVRDALHVGWECVRCWEKENRERACIRSLLELVEWELRVRELSILVGRRAFA